MPTCQDQALLQALAAKEQQVAAKEQACDDIDEPRLRAQCRAQLQQLRQQLAQLRQDVRFCEEGLWPPGILNATGKVSFLRVNEGGFGPPSDFLDAEVIFMLDTMANRAFGFQLRPDGAGPAHAGMLGLLRDSFNNHQTVTIDFNQLAGKRNNIAFRIALIRATGPVIGPLVGTV